MARNEEKAQAMLNRWYRMKRDLRNQTEGKYREIPEINKVTSLQDCEKMRTEVLKSISKMVSDIQNAGLGEHRIRELNDEINKAIREKNAWENRIKELGGPDYRRIGAKMYDTQGVELPGSGGYKYFGAAKDLPGVRELFQREVPYEPKKTRAEIYSKITYEYYGLGEDPFEEEEAEIEKVLRKQEIERFIQQNPDIIRIFFGNTIPSEQEVLQFANQELGKYSDSLKMQEEENQMKGDNENDDEDIQLEKRKKELLEKYFPKDKSMEYEYIKLQPRDVEGEEMVKQMIKMNT